MFLLTSMLTYCRVARRCNKDTEVNGIPIKEGCLVAIPHYYLHFRDDCWTDPEVFNPERFVLVIPNLSVVTTNMYPIAELTQEIVLIK